MKLCTKCKSIKSFTEFNKSLYGKNGLSSICKNCMKIYDQQRYYKQSEKYKSYNKKYRTEHKEELNQQRRIRYKRYRLNSNFRIIENLRRRTNTFLKEKSTHFDELLCCTTEYLWEHLTKQFKDGMTKENYGKIWQIDHIIPLKFFEKNQLLNDLTDQKLAFHYGNLQPLFINENIKKQDNIPVNTNFIY